MVAAALETIPSHSGRGIISGVLSWCVVLIPRPSRESRTRHSNLRSHYFYAVLLERHSLRSISVTWIKRWQRFMRIFYHTLLRLKNGVDQANNVAYARAQAPLIDRSFLSRWRLHPFSGQIATEQTTSEQRNPCRGLMECVALVLRSHYFE